MSAARMCQRFYCDHMGERVCCADCPERRICANPCRNDPSRCKLEDTGSRVRIQDISRINRDPRRKS